MELLTIKEAAVRLRVSETWVRRHLSELPVIRMGRLIKIDSDLLSSCLKETMYAGNSLKSERTIMVNRYQRGCVHLRGKKKKVWYGMFREDVRTLSGMERRNRRIRIGTLSEIPTKNAARNKLAELLSSQKDCPVIVDMTFKELTKRWEEAEGPTIKHSTLKHYTNAIRAYLLPVFGEQKIAAINREGIQKFLAEKAKMYSHSTLRSIRVSLGITLEWAKNCGWIERNPCSRIKLPKETGGRRVTRSVLTSEQIVSIADKLKEPYSTMVLFIAATGVRIGEAIAIQPSDIEGSTVTISRRIYNRNVDRVKSLKSVRKLPLDDRLVERIRSISGPEYVFQSNAGTPIDPGNALRRYIRPATKELGISLGGWHDFRHTLSTTLRRSGVHPKVISDILGHKKVNLAMDVYDRTDLADFTGPLSTVSSVLLPNATKEASVG